MTMVERVARAIFGDDEEWASIHPGEREYWIGRARAAIAAMRDPDETMKTAAVEAMARKKGWQFSFPVAWDAAIDAALTASPDTRPSSDGSESAGPLPRSPGT